MAIVMDAPKSLTDDIEAGIKKPEPAPPQDPVENRPTSAPPPKKAESELASDEPPNDDKPVATVDDDEKRFWAEIAVLGKITDCSENMEECERRINELKEEIKVEKEMLKGEQHRLQKLAIELRKIKAGHPLPVDPNAKKEDEKAKESASENESDDASSSDDAWRAKPTAELLDGLKGLGQKKLDALCDAAPTAGDLEDLRGEASRAHLSFKEKLPSGFGQKIADAIEDKLIEHVAKCAPSAEEQAAAEREESCDRGHILWETGDEGVPESILDLNGEVVLGLCKVCGKGESQLDDSPECEPNPIAGKIAEREREQMAEATQPDDDANDDADEDQYEDVDEDDIP